MGQKIDKDKLYSKLLLMYSGFVLMMLWLKTRAKSSSNEDFVGSSAGGVVCSKYIDIYSPTPVGSSTLVKK